MSLRRGRVPSGDRRWRRAHRAGGRRESQRLRSGCAGTLRRAESSRRVPARGSTRSSACVDAKRGGFPRTACAPHRRPAPNRGSACAGRTPRRRPPGIPRTSLASRGGAIRACRACVRCVAKIAACSPASSGPCLQRLPAHRRSLPAAASRSFVAARARDTACPGKRRGRSHRCTRRSKPRGRPRTLPPVRRRRPGARGSAVGSSSVLNPGFLRASPCSASSARSSCSRPPRRRGIGRVRAHL